jgi:ribosome-binding factor A
MTMSRRIPRKNLQLCAQVREALYWVLGSAVGDESLAYLQVVGVEPMPDASRLLVTMSVPDEMTVADAVNRLRNATKTIRAEVAASIRRRKAPELHFKVIHENGY